NVRMIQRTVFVTLASSWTLILPTRAPPSTYAREGCMKTKDIARRYGLEPVTFDQWLKQSGIHYKPGITGMSVDDSIDLEQLISNYRRHMSEEEGRLAQERERLAEQQRLADQ